MTPGTGPCQIHGSRHGLRGAAGSYCEQPNIFSSRQEPRVAAANHREMRGGSHRNALKTAMGVADSRWESLVTNGRHPEQPAEPPGADRSHQGGREAATAAGSRLGSPIGRSRDALAKGCLA